MPRGVIGVLWSLALCAILAGCRSSAGERSALATTVAASIFATQTAAAPPLPTLAEPAARVTPAIPPTAIQAAGPPATPPSAAPTPTSTPEPPAEQKSILIPAGAFQMGCDPARTPAGVCQPDEPLLAVDLDAYRIDETETTNAQYAKCVAAGSCTAPSRASSAVRTSYYGNPAYANFPVIWVSWHQATAYCAWAGKRLPTAAEWAKAARGTSDTRPYPWGDAEPSCTLANIQGCTRDTDASGSHPQGASPYGVLDLNGNVREWVSNWVRASADWRLFAKDPQGPVSGSYKMIFGGGWLTAPGDLQASGIPSTPATSYVDVGFRCAVGEDGATGQPASAATAARPVTTGAVTPFPTTQAAPPKPGTANASGRVFWNDLPVTGTDVNLCAQFSPLSGCAGNRYAAKTDAAGAFLFENVTPGQYSMLVHAVDVDAWFFYRPANALSFTGPITYSLNAGATTTFADMEIYKFDFEAGSPTPAERLDEERTVLRWQAYPGAAYYGVYIGRMATDVNGERVDGTAVTVTGLPVCQYWKLTAFNARGSKIAESSFMDFSSVRPAGSCGESATPVPKAPDASPTRAVAATRAAATATPPAPQTVPFQVIACPAQGVTIRAISAAKPGWWNVVGTADIPNLEYWKGELSADGNNWTVLYYSKSPVRDGVLVEFNTSTVPAGTYKLRLMVVDRTGNYPEPCVVEVSTP